MVMKNLEQTEKLTQEFFNLLKKHDWHYMMSDSHEVYMEGSRMNAEIRRKLAELINDYDVHPHMMRDSITRDLVYSNLDHNIVNNWFVDHIEGLARV
jgi:hypothetical protein